MRRSHLDLPLVAGDTVEVTRNGRKAAVGVGDLGSAPLPLNKQNGTAYTLTLGDAGKCLVFTNGSTVTLTVPTGLGAGFEVAIAQMGAGDVTPTAAVGVTISNRQSFTKTAGQYALISLVAVATDTFILAGDGA